MTTVKKRDYRIAWAGSILAAFFVALALSELGIIPVILFSMWIVMALSDAISGRIPMLLIISGIFMQVLFYPAAFVKFFAPVFIILVLMWFLIRKIRKKYELEKLEYGFGDTVGLPYAITLSWILLNFWGFVIFAVWMLIINYWMVQRKTVRLLPWITPPIIIIFVLAVLL
jgi:hypothetical protein